MRTFGKQRTVSCQDRIEKLRTDYEKKRDKKLAKSGVRALSILRNSNFGRIEDCVGLYRTDMATKFRIDVPGYRYPIIADVDLEFQTILYWVDNNGHKCTTDLGEALSLAK